MTRCREHEACDPRSLFVSPSDDDASFASPEIREDEREIRRNRETGKPEQSESGRECNRERLENRRLGTTKWRGGGWNFEKSI